MWLGRNMSILAGRKKDRRKESRKEGQKEIHVHKILLTRPLHLKREEIRLQIDSLLDSLLLPFSTLLSSSLNCLSALLDFHLKSPLSLSLLLLFSLITISPLSCPTTQWDVINCVWVRLLARSSSDI